MPASCAAAPSSPCHPQIDDPYLGPDSTSGQRIRRHGHSVEGLARECACCVSLGVDATRPTQAVGNFSFPTRPPAAQPRHAHLVPPAGLQQAASHTRETEDSQPLPCASDPGVPGTNHGNRTAMPRSRSRPPPRSSRGGRRDRRAVFDGVVDVRSLPSHPDAPMPRLLPVSSPLSPMAPRAAGARTAGIPARPLRATGKAALRRPQFVRRAVSWPASALQDRGVRPTARRPAFDDATAGALRRVGPARRTGPRAATGGERGSTIETGTRASLGADAPT